MHYYCLDAYRRNKTASFRIYSIYALHLYSSGLSLRKTSERLFPFIKRNHVSVWNYIQKYEPKRIHQKRKRVKEFIIDETLLKVGSSQYSWLWIAIEPLVDKMILGIRISFERTILVAEEQFLLNSLVNTYGKCDVSTDAGTWYPYACKFLKIKHHLHSFTI